MEDVFATCSSAQVLGGAWAHPSWILSSIVGAVQCSHNEGACGYLPIWVLESVRNRSRIAHSPNGNEHVRIPELSGHKKFETYLRELGAQTGELVVLNRPFVYSVNSPNSGLAARARLVTYTMCATWIKAARRAAQEHSHQPGP